LAADFADGLYGQTLEDAAAPATLYLHALRFNFPRRFIARYDALVARTRHRAQRSENSVRTLYTRRKTLGLSGRLENRFIFKKTSAIVSSFRFQIQN